MRSWGKAIGYGVLIWLIPFIVAILIFSIHESSRPLFESIMAVTVCSAAIGFGILYLGAVDDAIGRESIRLGILWYLIPVLIDAPLMLFGGPMKMSFGEYMADIGITYLCIPVATIGLGLIKSRSGVVKNESAEHEE